MDTATGPQVPLPVYSTTADNSQLVACSTGALASMAAISPGYSANGGTPFDLAFAYSPQPRDQMGHMLIGSHGFSLVHGSHGFQTPMGCSPPIPVPSTPISAGMPFTAQQLELSMGQAAAAIAMASSGAGASPLSLPMMPAAALLARHPSALTTVNSAPADLTEFSHDVLRPHTIGCPNAAAVASAATSVSPAGRTSYRYEHVFSVSERPAPSPSPETAATPASRPHRMSPLASAVSAVPHGRASVPLALCAGDACGLQPMAVTLAAPQHVDPAGGQTVAPAALELAVSARFGGLPVDTPPLTAHHTEDEDEEDRGGRTMHKASRSMAYMGAPATPTGQAVVGYGQLVGYSEVCPVGAFYAETKPHIATADVAATPKKRGRKSAGSEASPSSAAPKRRKTGGHAATHTEADGEASGCGRDDGKSSAGGAGCCEIKCPHPECDKRFTRKYNLKSHERTHTDERPYSCDICDQRFSRNHDLKRHKKIHSGARPFMCKFCDRGFARADALSRHTSKGPTCKRTASAARGRGAASSSAAAAGSSGKSATSTPAAASDASYASFTAAIRQAQSNAASGHTTPHSSGSSFYS